MHGSNQWEAVHLDCMRIFLGEAELGDRRVRLEDESMSLREYGVERGSVLSLEPQDPGHAKKRRETRAAEKARVAKFQVQRHRAQGQKQPTCGCVVM